MTGYIYLITNLISGKYYVGQTHKRTLQDRLREHIVFATGDRKARIYLAHAIRKYGSENFTIEPLTSVEGETEVELKTGLDQLEKLWIICLQSSDDKFGYNMTLGGEGGTPNAATRKKIGDKNRGRKWSEEARRKHAETWAKRGPHPNKGMKMPADRIKKMNDARLAKGISDATRLKWSIAGRGRKHTEEWKEAMSRRMSGVNNPMSKAS